jgi:hypothetical protein
LGNSSLSTFDLGARMFIALTKSRQESWPQAYFWLMPD